MYSGSLGQPYKPAICALQKIEKKKSPISKIKVLIKTSELLFKSIHQFYNSLNRVFNNIVDGDEILSIYTYIAAKSEIHQLMTHCLLIEKFATNNILNSISGYYLTTL